MIRRQAGFTLIELMITMVIFVLAIAAASNIFTGLLTQFKQQSKIAETNIEGMIGLEMLRQDVANAGYGLPWVIPATVAYNETAVGVAYFDCDGAPVVHNDCSGTEPCDPPRAILSGDCAGFNGSDVLIVKATNIALSNAAQRWTHQRLDGTGTEVIKDWDVPSENFEDAERLIIISSGTEAEMRQLVVSSFDNTIWRTTYVDATNTLADANFAPLPPPAEPKIHFLYGISPADPNPIRMPFNRADYSISTANVPDRCAVADPGPGAGTGVLVKSVIEQATGNRGAGLPLVDCVADMQVVYLLDTTGDGILDTTTNDITTVTADAQDIRDFLREVRVYVLVHEGQRDPSFTFNNFTCGVDDCIRVGFPRFPAALSGGRDFNFTTIATPILNWENYRWKVYTIVVRPANLEPTTLE